MTGLTRTTSFQNNLASLDQTATNALNQSFADVSGSSSYPQGFNSLRLSRSAEEVGALTSSATDIRHDTPAPFGRPNNPLSRSGLLARECIVNRSGDIFPNPAYEEHKLNLRQSSHSSGSSTEEIESATQHPQEEDRDSDLEFALDRVVDDIYRRFKAILQPRINLLADHSFESGINPNVHVCIEALFMFHKFLAHYITHHAPIPNACYAYETAKLNFVCQILIDLLPDRCVTLKENLGQFQNPTFSTADSTSEIQRDNRARRGELINLLATTRYCQLDENDVAGIKQRYLALQAEFYQHILVPEATRALPSIPIQPDLDSPETLTQIETIKALAFQFLETHIPLGTKDELNNALNHFQYNLLSSARTHPDMDLGLLWENHVRPDILRIAQDEM